MKEYEELQWFLIQKFIVLLVIVGIIEYALITLINRIVMPTMSMYFFPDAAGRIDLGGFQVVAVLILMLLSVIVWGVQGLLPPAVSSMLDWLREGLDRLAGWFVPSMGVGITYMDDRHRMLFFLFLFVIVFVLLLPFLLGAFIYARIVTRQFTKIQQMREEAKKEYDRKRNLMLSDIAHDLRTPITTVSGYAAALSDGMVAPEKQQEYLDAIRNKSVRMNDLITLLFDYVRLDSEGFSLTRTSLDLCELLRENAALVYSDIENAGMELEIQIPDKRIEVSADELQLSRVITNLLINAVRHNDAGIRIGLHLIEDEDRIFVAVADTGACIEEELKEHLFEPFARGDKSRSSSGSGLGLSIARSAVRMHGWELTLVQQPRLQKLSGLERYAKAFIIQIKFA